jgi:hypothetical protein
MSHTLPPVCSTHHNCTILLLLPEVRLLIFTVTKPDMTHNIYIICLPVNRRLFIGFGDTPPPNNLSK